MLRRILWASLALAVGLFGISTATSAQNSASVRCRLDAATLPAGSETRLVIEVANVANLYGYQLILNFPTASLDLLDGDASRSGVNAALGVFLSPDFVVANTVDAETGRLSLALVQMNPSQPKSGTGELASIRFKTKTAGAINFALTGVILSDPVGNPLAASLEGCTLNGSASPTPPTPSTQPPAAATATPTHPAAATATPTRTAATATAIPLPSATPTGPTEATQALDASPTTEVIEPAATEVPTVVQPSATPAPQTPVPATVAEPALAASDTPTAQSFASATAETRATSVDGKPPEGGSSPVVTLGLLVPLVVLGAAGGYLWLRRKK